MVELLQKASVVNGGFWQSMLYKQQLQALFNDGTKKGSADNVLYSERSISEHVNKQYQGSPQKKPKNVNSQWWILVSSFEISEEKITTFMAADYSSNIAPVVGGYIANINRNFGELLLFHS
jgi:hypothetical protein